MVSVPYQVVSISPDGEVETLDRRGRGLDLRKIGTVTVERASLVEFSEARQQWFVRLLRAPFQGMVLGRALWERVGRPHRGFDVDYFERYDDAVAAEIEFLETARLEGFLS